MGALVDAPPEKTMLLPFEPLAGAEFSPDRAHRYTLWRKTKPKGETILFIGLNPSTADEWNDDHTVTRMIRFGILWGYATVLVGNLFAYRATDPKVMKRYEDPVGPGNDEALSELRARADLCVCCWGNQGRWHGRGAAVVELLRKYGKLHSLGMTKVGYPKHPLYLRRTTPVEVMV